MRFSTVSVAAFAATVYAQGIIPTDAAGASVLQVLATALPSDVISAAVSDPSGFSVSIASLIAASSTPSWYVALPSDVKSYLLNNFPAQTSAVTTTEPTPTPTPPPVVGTAGTSGAPVGGNSTDVTSVSSPTLSSSGSGSSPSSSPTGGDDQDGAASIPKAAFGAGLVGAIAMVGMLAL